MKRIGDGWERKPTKGALIELSAIIVNWNTRELLRRCLAAVQTTVRTPCELFVVDNGSSDGSPAMVREQFPSAVLIANAENRGFAVAVNQALARATGRALLLLNSDAEVQPGAVDTLVRFLDTNPRAGICGPRLRNGVGQVQLSFGACPTVWREAARKWVWNPLAQSRQGARFLEWRYRRPARVDWVLGACFMIRRDTITQIGSLDERFFFYFEEVDWCLRARRAGWEVRLVPDAEVIHLGGQSAARDPQRLARERRKSQRRFYEKHHPRWQRWLLDRYLGLRGIAAGE